MKELIEGRREVVLMVDLFYDLVRKDELIGPIFISIIGDNWETHLSRMYLFWETLLFGRGDYKGSPFEAHMNLPISPAHFKRWLFLFELSMATHFEGENASKALMRAQMIAKVFQAKMGLLK